MWNFVIYEFNQQFCSSVFIYLKFYIYFTEEKDLWGVKYGNNSGTGIQGDMMSRRSDITCAAIYRWQDLYEFTLYSSNMQQARVMMVVPRPKILPYFETPLLPFPIEVWLAILLTTVINICLLYGFEKMLWIISKLNENSPERQRQGWSYAFLSVFRGTVFEGTNYWYVFPLTATFSI